MSEDKMTLGELLKHIRFEDIHLTHADEDIELATIAELNDNTLTSTGKEAWKDVLNATVAKIYEGGYGVQLECTDVEPERLTEFSYVLAGYVSATMYDSWINDSTDGQEPSEQTINL